MVKLLIATCIMLVACTTQPAAQVVHGGSGGDYASASGYVSTSGRGKWHVAPRGTLGTYTITKPKTPKDVTLNDAPTCFKVGKGETMYSLSKRYHVPIASIVQANRLKAPYTIYPDQKICIIKPNIHMVKRGETLFSVSRQYGVDVRQLVTFNRMKEPYGIEVGQILMLPTAYGREQVTPERKHTVAVPRPLEVQPVVRRPEVAISTSQEVKKKLNRHEPAKPSYASPFIWPLQGKILTGFGAQGKGVYNDGINIQARIGDGVRVTSTGHVVYVGTGLKGYGNLIIVKHAGGWLSAYGHLSDIFVRKGQPVTQGDVIGEAGASGKVDRPQLFFAIRKGREAVDPLSKLRK